MTLTNDDLQKIKAVVDSGHELTRSYVDQKIEGLRKDMATKQDLLLLEERLNGKIDSVKQMLEENHAATVGDVELLKSQVAQPQAK
ncbi:hypothetical protein HY375_00350 [Candidatus Berkelbacteria bacterium]|nr:hypothetical protein [Candidatus Berkelbacteria bacterium]